ncbi:MAG TPA: YggT family protein [Gaiellales bacterium]
MPHLLASLIANAVSVYTLLILAAVVLSWMRSPRSPALAGIRSGIQSLTLPYLGLFRRLVPPLGRLDLSPMVAVIALQVFGGAAAATVAQL